jgi:hypothetical protein
LIATFAVKLRVNYLNCVLMGNDGNCVDQGWPTEDLFDFQMMIGNPFDMYGTTGAFNSSDTTCYGSSHNGGLIIMVDGVVMGKDSIMLPMVPLGQSEVIMQVASGPFCHDYREIEIHIVSDCEQNMILERCTMKQPEQADYADDHALYTSTALASCGDRVMSIAKFDVSWIQATESDDAEMDMNLNEQIPSPSAGTGSRGALEALMDQMELREARTKVQSQQLKRTAAEQLKRTDRILSILVDQRSEIQQLKTMLVLLLIAVALMSFAILTRGQHQVHHRPSSGTVDTLVASESGASKPVGL